MIGQSVETGQATIGMLLNVAIRLEVAAERFYKGLAVRFSHCPEVAAFWRTMAADEVCHKSRLAEWAGTMDGGRLSQPVDAKMLRMGQKLLDTSVEDLLDRVEDLDDAYETAHELESSETNVIFRFFIKEFADDPRIIAAMRHDLDEHAERLMTAFPAAYDVRSARRGVLPLQP